MQNVFWFTDEDAIAANDDRLGDLTNLFAWISSQYLSFSMGHFRVGTSKSDDGSRQLEDFISIPDLVAGAFSEQLNLPLSGAAKTSGDYFWIYRPDMSMKTRAITNWLADVSCSLKKVLCIVEPKPDRSGQLISLHHFYNKL